MRHYQSLAIQKVDEAIAIHGRTLLVLPTGTGKTKVFAEYIKHKNPKRTLVLCNREEIVRQSVDEIRSVTERTVHIEQASARAGPHASVVVASINTIGREARLMRFMPDVFDFIVVDEAHHCVRDTMYARVLDHFTGASVLGVTATDYRLDGIPLDLFRSVAYRYHIMEAILDGYLCDIESRFIRLKDLSLVRMKKAKGDYVQKELEKAYNEDILDAIVDNIGEQAGDRSTIAFTVSVAQAQYMASRSKVPASAVHGELSKGERKRILDRFRDGDIRHLYNVAVMTEGVNLPMTSCIAMCRPTLSRGLYSQMLGRGLRLFENKPNCLVLDFVGNSLEHDTMCVVDALFPNHPQRKGVLDRLLHIDDLFTVDALERAVNAIKAAQERIEAPPPDRPKRLLSGAEALSALSMTIPPGNWNGSKPTDAQSRALNRFGIQTGDLDRYQASQLLGTLFVRARDGLSTPAQIQLGKRLGIECLHLTKSTSSSMLQSAMQAKAGRSSHCTTSTTDSVHAENQTAGPPESIQG